MSADIPAPDPGQMTDPVQAELVTVGFGEGQLGMLQTTLQEGLVSTDLTDRVIAGAYQDAARKMSALHEVADEASLDEGEVLYLAHANNPYSLAGFSEVAKESLRGARQKIGVTDAADEPGASSFTDEELGVLPKGIREGLDPANESTDGIKNVYRFAAQQVLKHEALRQKGLREREIRILGRSSDPVDLAQFNDDEKSELAMAMSKAGQADQAAAREWLAHENAQLKQ